MISLSKKHFSGKNTSGPIHYSTDGSFKQDILFFPVNFIRHPLIGESCSVGSLPSGGDDTRHPQDHINRRIHADATMNDSSSEQNTSFWEYNTEYERQGQRETVWAGDCHFVDQSWLLGDGEQIGEIAVTNGCPIHASATPLVRK